MAGSPSEPRVVGTKKLQNRGVVYELDSADTALWVRSGKSVFTDGFGGMSIVKEQATSVIVEYIPVSHSPDALAENHRIEHDSRLGVGMLLTTRWIKPLHRCAPDQQCAHLIT